MNQKFKLVESTNEQISNIKDYIFRIISSWKWFLASLIIAFGIAYYINISATKIYGLKTTIAVKEKQNPLFASGTSIAFNWGGASDKVESIKKGLTSRSHNEKVVKRLDFYIDYLADGRFGKVDAYGKVPFKLELQPNQFQLINNLIEIEFKTDSTFQIKVDFESKENYNLYNYKNEETKIYNNTSTIYTNQFSVNEYINLDFLKGQVVVIKENQKLQGKTYYIKLNKLNATVAKYRGVRANDLKGTSLVEITLTGPNKARLVDYLNTTVEVLAEDQLLEKTNYARATKAFIDEQFKNTADSLRLIEDNIGKFKQDNAIYQLSAEGSEIFSQTTSLDRNQAEIRDKIQYYKNLINYIESQNDYTNIPAPAVINIEDPTIPSMIGKLTDLSIQKERLQSEVTPNHPTLIQINQEIATTKNVLLENLSSLIEASEIALINSRRRLSSYNYELNKLPEKEQKLLNFERKYSLTETNVKFLMQKRYEADIAISSTVSDISVLDKAKDTGQQSILPRTSFNYMIALLLGILVPLFIIIVLQIFDNRVHTTEDIERISPIPLLGVVGKNLAANNLAVYLKPKSSVAESFRALRSNIQFLFTRNLKDKAKTIVTTSSVSGEGKTFISINMATVFALGGKKTVLVGLDLRKPKIFGDFELDNDEGVINYLIGEKSLESIIQKSKIENLDVITSGPVPPNPSELLISDELEEMIIKLKETYEYVILDTPPIGIVSDAVELLKYADATLYIVRQSYTQKAMLKMINDKFAKDEIKNISIVLNDFKMKFKYGYGSGYGYGYGYGYGKYAKGYHEHEKQNFWSKLFKRNSKFK